MAQNGNGPRVREFLARQRPKKTVKLMRTAKKEQSKTSSSYETKPARKTKNPQKKHRQLKQVPTRNPYRRETGERGQRRLHSKVSQPTGRRTGRFSKARRRETRCRILWSTMSPSRKTSQLSRERMEGTDLTRFVFDQTRAGLRLTSWPKVVPSASQNKIYLRWHGVPAC